MRKGARVARILIAEDEADLLDALVQLLEHEGHEVEGAADGVDALARFAARPFDLVMLDVMLPKIDGLIDIRIAGGSRRSPSSS